MVKEERVNFLSGSNLSIEFLSIKHFHPHYHTAVIEFIIMIRGSITIISNFETVTLNEGEFFTIDQRDVHFLHSCDSENLVLSIHINLKPYFKKDENFKHNLFVFEHYNQQNPGNKNMRHTIDRLMAIGYLHAANREMTKESYNQLAENLADRMNRYFSLINFITDYKNLPKHKEDTVRKILLYITNNYMNKVSLSTLSEYLHFNKSYLARFLKELTNFNFSRALNYYRCSEAEFLLLTTELPNEEICIRCGFSNQKLFYENFKDWWDVTPYQHRQNFKNYMQEQDNYKTVQPVEIYDIFKEEYCEYHLKNELDFTSFINAPADKL